MLATSAEASVALRSNSSSTRRISLRTSEKISSGVISASSASGVCRRLCILKSEAPILGRLNRQDQGRRLIASRMRPHHNKQYDDRQKTSSPFNTVALLYLERYASSVTTGIASPVRG